MIGIYKTKRTLKRKDFYNQVVNMFANNPEVVVKKEDSFFRLKSNIIIGDIDNTDILICAHYDQYYTCLFLIIPIIFRRFKTYLDLKNIYMFLTLIFYMLVAIFLLYLYNLSLMIFVLFAILLAFPISLFLSNGDNDNTSGVDIALQFAGKPNVAVVLFDKEETGLCGSRFFKKKHKEVLDEKLIINLDTVGKGNIICLSPSPSLNDIANSIAEKLNQSFLQESRTNDKRECLVFDKMLPGDHTIFKDYSCIGITRADKDSKGRLYAQDIHTWRDVLFYDEMPEKECLEIESNLNQIEVLVKDIIDEYKK